MHRSAADVRALLLWRIAFVIVLIAQSAGTHIPRMSFAPPQHPVDKFIHATAAGVLMAMLWQTRWIPSRLWCAVVMGAWFAVDEWTQSIPGLNRSAELMDWCADALGILCACMLMAAIRPVPGVIATLVDRRRRVLSMLLTSRATNWLHMACGVVLGAPIGALVGWGVDSRVPRVSDPRQALFMGGIFGALAGFYLMREFGIRTLERRVAPQNPCLSCGTIPDAQHAEGAGASGSPQLCTTCGARQPKLAWQPFASLNGREEFRICAPIVAMGLAVFVLLAGAAIFLPTMVATEPAVMRLNYWYENDMPKDMRRLIDIVGICAIGAWTYRMCKKRIARALDLSGQRCLACGYDLRAMETQRDGGVCTECGEPFVRVAQP